VVRALHEMALGRPAQILDIGCSTGNFLRLLKNMVPSANLTGGDLMDGAIEECRSDLALAGMDFAVMDIFDLPVGEYDVVVANAVAVYFELDEYILALESIAKALRPGGYLVSFDWIFSDDREKRVVEVSEGHPMGLKFWLRGGPSVRHAIQAAGFEWCDILPFNVPVDLPIGEVSGLDPELRTKTVVNPLTGFREQFRGDLYQPWAHVLARKKIHHAGVA